MKTKMKALTLALCAVLLVATTVFVTVAFLTSTSDVVTNTFTVGNVAITLDEAKVESYGRPIDAEGNIIDDYTKAPRVISNNYKLIPGHEYTKDPTVHVAAGSENCWLFVKVDNGIDNIEDKTEKGNTIAAQMTALGWTPIAEGSNIYYYEKIVSAENDVVVFNNFKLAGDAAVADYASAEITIIAYAVQADGFDTAAAAWEAAPTWNN